MLLLVMFVLGLVDVGVVSVVGVRGGVGFGLV